jgi:hypothetical protein
MLAVNCALGGLACFRFLGGALLGGLIRLGRILRRLDCRFGLLWICYPKLS